MQRWRGVVMAVTVLVAMAMPARAVGPELITGDVTDPTVQSFTVSPGAADVTAAPQQFDATLDVSDDFSGVEEAYFLWVHEAETWGGRVDMDLASGDSLDGTWTGTFTVDSAMPPGRYRFTLTAADRVGNKRTLWAADLAGQGMASGVDIANDDPDVDAPRVTGVDVSPDLVDAREGDAPVTIDIAAEDDDSGVWWVSVHVEPPAATHGATAPPTTARVSGTDNAGVWRASMTVPEYSRQGRWRLRITVFDRFRNRVELDGDVLADAGFDSGFDVVSHEDVDAPDLPVMSFEPSEVGVHDEDQVVRLRVRATDALAGVRKWAQSELYNIQFRAQDPVTGQIVDAAGMELVSGDPNDGEYEASVVVPKSSATGLRPVSFFAVDDVGNARSFVAGSLLVYNVPLPPLPLGADPADGAVDVRWDPPTDARGAEVTGYVVREARTGQAVRTSGSARSARVTGLANEVVHTFTVTAVNKAGESDPSNVIAATPRAGSGYWMAGTAGHVYGFGDARWHGNAPGGAVDIEPTPARTGYWIVDAAGRVSAHGAASTLGSAGALSAGESVTSMSATPSGRGYWLFTNRGRVLRFGDAVHLGDMAHVPLNGPVLDSVATPSGKGYYMVAADGGVFAFGDARFAGSMASVRLNAPVQSLVPDPDGAGYWLVASDGGVFAFGAPFHGSMGSKPLNRPVTGMVGSRTGHGYLMVAEDGGIFAFGDAPFRGSLGSSPPSAPITAVAAY